MMEYVDYWDSTHEKYFDGKIVYDNWLDSYLEIINTAKTPILDLGCGTGNNTLYLKEHGFNVIACDYSAVALNIIKDNFLDVDTKLFDMQQPFPFEDESFDIIIADLCLHYFDDAKTKEIIKEIKRILTEKGVLIARVNSISDVNFGANKGEKIEKNFYFVEGYKKRFFDLEDANKYFSIIGVPMVLQRNMNRYSKEKKVYEIVVQNN